MCGIAGFSIASGEAEFDRRLLAASLLREIEPRGRDASGIAWRSATSGNTFYMKEPIPASQFAPTLNESVDYAAAAILHTRFATQGSPKVEENNHPILRDSVVGVHNGCLRNDREIFDLVGGERYGEVDSEAIFALLDHLDDLGGDPARRFDALGLLAGSMAVAWLPVGERELWLARGSGSPLFVGRTARGSLIFASTEKAIRAASLKAGIPVRKVVEIEEGSVLRIVGGRVVEQFTFTPDSGGVKAPTYGSGFSKHGTVASAPKAKKQRKQKRRHHRHVDQQELDLPEGTRLRRWNDSTRLDVDEWETWNDDVDADDPYAYAEDWDDEAKWDDEMYFDSLRKTVKGERA